MTELIDVNSAQPNIDMRAVKAAGVGAVIVKAGGFNVTPLYVAPHYASQVDAARAAGLHVGHYWVVGNGDPTTEADFFTRHLHGFDRDHDVLVLDDERLDGNPTFWSDGHAATFLRRIIATTGITPDRVWIYTGAANARSTTWPNVNALGVRWWVAAYGNDDGARHPAPTVPWDVHQYTSQGHVAGVTVDRSYSPHSLDDLFGGTVALTPDDISKIAAAVAPAVWKQALDDKQTGVHQASTFLIWGSRNPVAAAPATAPAGAAPTHAELVAALTDPTVQAAIAATLVKHLPTKIVGTLGV